VLCGGPADAKAHDRLRAAVGVDVHGHLHDFSAAVPLQDTGGIIARTDLCIGVDTGLVHLAASFGVPVVVLVGPTDPNQWAPWMTSSEVVRSPRVVRGLRDRLRARFGVAAAAGLRWPLGRASMDDIGVAEVMERVDRLLPSATSAPDPEPAVVRTIDFRDGGFTYVVVSRTAAAVPATKPLAHAH
jgi:ADP-heptose:LPS heptosyltransferase